MMSAVMERHRARVEDGLVRIDRVRQRRHAVASGRISVRSEMVNGKGSHSR
jgi:hypothetical protein